MVPKMNGNETGAAALKNPAIGLKTAPVTMTAAGRLLGLNAGDWSMIVLGLLLSALLMALA
jgi:hypothetical protein